MYLGGWGGGGETILFVDVFILYEVRLTEVKVLFAASLWLLCFAYGLAVRFTKLNLVEILISSYPPT